MSTWILAGLAETAEQRTTNVCFAFAYLPLLDLDPTLQRERPVGATSSSPSAGLLSHCARYFSESM